MGKMIRVTDIYKDIEKDHVENGCDPNTHQTVDNFYSSALNISRPTFQGIVDYLATTLGLSSKPGDYRAFEDGRIIFQRLEDDNGFLLAGEKLVKFNTGQATAWSATYNIHLEIVVDTYVPTKAEMVESFGVQDYDA